MLTTRDSYSRTKFTRAPVENAKTGPNEYAESFVSGLIMQDDQQTFCPVILVSNTAGVMAASCIDIEKFTSKDAKFKIAIGINNAELQGPFNIKDITPHDGYNSDTFSNNIAVVQFDDISGIHNYNIAGSADSWGGFTFVHRTLTADNGQWNGYHWFEGGPTDTASCSKASTLFEENTSDLMCNRANRISIYNSDCNMPFKYVVAHSSSTAVTAQLGFYSHTAAPAGDGFCGGGDLYHFYTNIAHYVRWIEGVIGDSLSISGQAITTHPVYRMKDPSGVSKDKRTMYSIQGAGEIIEGGDDSDSKPSDTSDDNSHTDDEEDTHTDNNTLSKDEETDKTEKKSARLVESHEAKAEVIITTVTTTEEITTTETDMDTVFETDIQTEQTTVTATTTEENTTIQSSTITESNTETIFVTDTVQYTETVFVSNSMKESDFNQLQCPTPEPCLSEDYMSAVTVTETITKEPVTVTEDPIGEDDDSEVDILVDSSNVDSMSIAAITVTVTEYTETVTETTTEMGSCNTEAATTDTDTEEESNMHVGYIGGETAFESSTDDEMSDNTDGGSLSGKAIGGIIAGILIALLILAAFAYFYIRRRRRMREIHNMQLTHEEVRASYYSDKGNSHYDMSSYNNPASEYRSRYNSTSGHI
ncbi:hypothetical protein COEREDRAFT_84924 [Coemansia reversa NRRL 1564]|uniref:Peptidase S1 domain-containing protein n=1 Tax=Coemansia reversa (strain ATCC 12441 / NRRL 1564) TaxID=763665 RepID=A0A2G5BJR9_COERN|nr:hypothetical protein COEREDRAFT_84924 [Coemansia reversa NRRL 1564]|eukprot:PIA18987.1 hypothetical protein COEREDRAFT_84924 [Coemansia reversa NRRL 1564]